jgi:hypothetical protein
MGNELRVVYVPQAQAVMVKHLAANANYSAVLFDPVRGGQVTLGELTTDASGSWECQPPQEKHDWVLVLASPSAAGK